MAPMLRNSTRQKTSASAKAAKDGGYARRPRRPTTRKQRYTRNKGLVSMKIPKALEHISFANTTKSPLLQLPAEIRNMIFKFAVRPTSRIFITCYTNRRGRISRSSTSTRISKLEVKDLGLELPRVCRQIYAETATLIYAENCFVFICETAAQRWITRRLLAQRAAIRWIMLPSRDYSHRYFVDGSIKHVDYRPRITSSVRISCPNLVELRENVGFDRCPCSLDSEIIHDDRRRIDYPSSGDEDFDELESEYWSE